ncbi:hypothetical protein BASA81_005588 [Batrachochytrium salamandrivorans]|nr:hypothetical protein BASA81_005588 [Batrachochytrium salamandrivorans]
MAPRKTGLAAKRKQSEASSAAVGGVGEGSLTRKLLGEQCLCHAYSPHRCSNCFTEPPSLSTGEVVLETKLPLIGTDEIKLDGEEFVKQARRIACDECRKAVLDAIPNVTEVAVLYNPLTRVVFAKATTATGGKKQHQQMATFRLSAQQLPSKAPTPAYLLNAASGEEEAVMVPATTSGSKKKKKRKSGGAAAATAVESPSPSEETEEVVKPLSPHAEPLSLDDELEPTSLPSPPPPPHSHSHSEDDDSTVFPEDLALDSINQEQSARLKCGLAARFPRPGNSATDSLISRLQLRQRSQDAFNQVTHSLQPYFSSGMQYLHHVALAANPIPVDRTTGAMFAVRNLLEGWDDVKRRAISSELTTMALLADLAIKQRLDGLRVDAAMGDAGAWSEFVTNAEIMEKLLPEYFSTMTNHVLAALAVSTGNQDFFAHVIEPDENKRKLLWTARESQYSVLLSIHVGFSSLLVNLRMALSRVLGEVIELLLPKYGSPNAEHIAATLDTEGKDKLFYAIPQLPSPLGSSRLSFTLVTKLMLSLAECMYLPELQDRGFRDFVASSTGAFTFASLGALKQRINFTAHLAQLPGKPPGKSTANLQSPNDVGYSLPMLHSAIQARFNPFVRAFVIETNTELALMWPVVEPDPKFAVGDRLVFKNEQLRNAVLEILFLVDFEVSSPNIFIDTLDQGGMQLALRKQQSQAETDPDYDAYIHDVLAVAIMAWYGLLDQTKLVEQLLVDGKQTKVNQDWRSSINFVIQGYFKLRIECKVDTLLHAGALLRQSRESKLCASFGMLGAQRIIARLLQDSVKKLVVEKLLMQDMEGEEVKLKKKKDVKEQAALRAKQEREKREEDAKAAKIAKEALEAKRREEEELARKEKLDTLEEMRKQEAAKMLQLREEEESRQRALRFEQKHAKQQQQLVSWACVRCTVENSQPRDSKPFVCYVCEWDRDAPLPEEVEQPVVVAELTVVEPPVVEPPAMMEQPTVMEQSAVIVVEPTAVTKPPVLATVKPPMVVRSGPIGLSNATGENSCFLNSALQCLFHVPRVRHEICYSMHVLECQVDDCFQCCLNKTFMELHTSPITVSSVEIRIALAKLGFAMNEKADSVEALLIILEQIERTFPNLVGCRVVCGVECPTCKSALDAGQLQTNPTTLSFYVNYGMVPRVNAPFTSFIHDASAGLIGHSDEIDSFNEKVLLASTEELVSCPVCDTGSLEPERRVIANPGLYIIGLTWPSASSSRAEIKAVLECISLDVDVTAIEGESSGIDVPNRILASLRSLTCYYGKHCVCFCLCEDGGGWYLFDDFNVKLVGKTWVECAQHILSCSYQPVSLFYEPNPMLREFQCRFQGCKL